jgi:hypothetical protein
LVYYSLNSTAVNGDVFIKSLQRSTVEIPSNSIKYAKIWFIDIQVLEFLMVQNYNSPQNSINICFHIIFPTVNQSELRTYTKGVPFKEKSSFHFAVLWQILNGME